MKIVILILFLGLIGCNKDSKVVATIDGTPIYAKEVDAHVKSRLARIETQVFDIKKEGLEELVDKKLLERTAAKNKLTVEEFVAKEAGSVLDPSEEELKAMYEARKGEGAQPFAEIKGEFAQLVKQSRQNRARQQLVEKLRSEANVVILMQPPRVAVSVDDDPAIGPEAAKVTIIEFSDYQCPFCGRSRSTVNQILETYKDQVRYVFRDFPLSFHKDAFAAHVAAQCAGEQGKYWDYNNKLFGNQQALKEDSLKQYATDLGLNLEAFNLCLASDKYVKEIQKDMDDGVTAGVTGTPAFFINGVLISGARPFSAFKEIIDNELKR